MAIADLLVADGRFTFAWLTVIFFLSMYTVRHSAASRPSRVGRIVPVERAHPLADREVQFQRILKRDHNVHRVCRRQDRWRAEVIERTGAKSELLLLRSRKRLAISGLIRAAPQRAPVSSGWCVRRSPCGVGAAQCSSSAACWI